jgi:hypothetical protein
MELVRLGLFFFRGKSGAPFAVVSPGGGFAYVGFVHEGFPYAVEINKRGYNAFVLNHEFGLGVGTSAEGWIGDAVRFWTSEIERARVDRSAQR